MIMRRCGSGKTRSQRTILRSARTSMWSVVSASVRHGNSSAGPHVVVTSTYPDESRLSEGLPKDSAVFELGNMNAKEISDLLAKLTDELVEKGQVDKSTAASVAPAGLWVRLLEATQRTINSFGCAWSFKIDAGPISANLHSCQTQ